MRAILAVSLLALTALAGCAAPEGSFAYQEPADHGTDNHEHAHDAPQGSDDAESSSKGPATPGADTTQHQGGTAGDHHTPGMKRPQFPTAEGSVPSAEDAKSMPQVSRIRLIGDTDLSTTGHATGNGTLEDPFVITGYYVTGDLYIQDTDACFVIKENYIGGQLSLNWNGQCVHVHHNYIHDLRVNENIRRDGLASGGLMELNEIAYIGQLRHYDGEFRHNVAGPVPATAPFDEVLETVPFIYGRDPRVANVDGFNQGIIHNNTFYGSVDLDFHGHHHGAGFLASMSHYHGDDEAYDLGWDHTQRYTSVKFADNLIIDPEGYGLRYEDQNHRGDDRTANSEQEEELKDAHVHYSMIEIVRNRIEGSGIWVDVFNADDQNHHDRNDGWLYLDGNVIVFQERDDGLFGFWGPWRPHVGIQVRTVKELELSMQDNDVTFLPMEQTLLEMFSGRGTPIGFEIAGLHDGNVTFIGNTATGFQVGLAASRWSDADWILADNHFGDADEPTRFDSSIPDPSS